MFHSAAENVVIKMTWSTILFQKDGPQASLRFGECKLLEHVQVTDAIDRFLCAEGMSNILTNEHSTQTSILGLFLIFWRFADRASQYIYLSI